MPLDTLMIIFRVIGELRISLTKAIAVASWDDHTIKEAESGDGVKAALARRSKGEALRLHDTRKHRKLPETMLVISCSGVMQ